MPTEFESTTYAAQSAAASNSGNMIATSELISGKVSFLQCSVTTPAGTGTADTILLGYLPSGMTLVPDMSTVTVDAAAGASTLDIGIATNSTLFAAELDISAVTSGLLGTVGTSTGAPYKSTERTAIVATLSGAVTAAKAIRFSFFLVNSN